MLLGMLAIMAVTITCVMFATKQMMMGFPSGIFWALAGGQAYTLSTTAWDMYYSISFASFGMTIFCVLAMYALRTRKEEAEEGDQFFDEGGDKDIKFIDEGGKGGEDVASDGEKPSRRTRGVRERAEKRRTRWD